MIERPLCRNPGEVPAGCCRDFSGLFDPVHAREARAQLERSGVIGRVWRFPGVQAWIESLVEMRRALNWRGTELGLREVVLELFFIIQDKGGLLDGLVYFLKDFLQFLLEAVVGDVVQDECAILEALNCGLGFFDDDRIWIRGEKDFRVVEGDVLGMRERAFRKALNPVSVEGPAKDLFSPSYLESLFELVPVCR